MFLEICNVKAKCFQSPFLYLISSGFAPSVLMAISTLPFVQDLYGIIFLAFIDNNLHIFSIAPFVKLLELSLWNTLNMPTHFLCVCVSIVYFPFLNKKTPGKTTRRSKGGCKKTLSVVLTIFHISQDAFLFYTPLVI